MLRIRDAAVTEAAVLERLQRRSSNVWEAYREQLAANPDAIEMPQTFLDSGWVRVAVDVKRAPIGFSVVIPAPSGLYELDGLFVDPAHMARGVGKALVQDAVERASCQGAACLK